MSSVAEVTSAASATNEAEVANLPFVKVDEARIQEHLDDVVRRTVEEGTARDLSQIFFAALKLGISHTLSSCSISTSPRPPAPRRHFSRFLA